MPRSPLYFRCLSLVLTFLPLLFKTKLLLGFLDVMIRVRDFNIKKSIWNSRFDPLSETQLLSLLTSERAPIWDAIWRCAFIHPAVLRLPAALHPLWPVKEDIFLKWLTKAFVSISNKGSFVPYFLFSQLCIFALVFISILWFFL